MTALAEEIVRLYHDRRKRYNDLHANMQAIRTIYYGEMPVDLPEIDGFTNPPVPNLLAQGVDQLAGRITSTIPQVQVLSVDSKRREVRRAATAEKVHNAWWQMDLVPATLKRRARHYVAYGLTSTSVMWDFVENRPRREVRDPLATFPDPDVKPEDVHVGSVIHVYQHTAKWLRARGYNVQLNEVTGGGLFTVEDERLMTVLDYFDTEKRVQVLIGTDQTTSLERGSILNIDEHGLGITPATVTVRAGLDRLSGQFDQMTGMYKTQAHLMALEILAVQRGIFPDTYLVSRSGEIGRFIDGPHDGRSGKINIVAGGDIKTEQVQPGYLTQQTIDRIERNQRVSGRLPAEFGGEAASNVRTGRRGDSLLSSTIDMDVADAQDALARTLAVENEISAMLAAKWDKGKTRTLRVATGPADKSVTFIADEVFADNYDNTVAYPASGSDVNQLIVGVGQRVGLGTMSKRTAAELDPLVGDAEVEHDRIIGEGLEQALLAGLQQQASAGALPPMVLSKVMKLVQSDKMELADALHKVTEDAMKEQQAQAEAQQAQAPQTPDAAMAGAATQSLAGAGPEAMSPIPGVGQGSSDLVGMLANLRLPLAGMQNRVGVEGAQ